MASRYNPNLCLELTQQYANLLKEAKKIRHSSNFESNYPPTIKQYQANQDDQERTERLMLSLCSRQSSEAIARQDTAELSVTHNKPNENTEQWNYGINFGDLLEQLTKPK